MNFWEGTLTGENFLREHLSKSQTRPFLFVGSGFSRRYLGIPNWEDLLRQFATPIGEYEYFLSCADSKMPKVASHMVPKYADYWWHSAKTQDERDLYKQFATRMSSPLKISIAHHLNTLPVPSFADALQEEFEELKAMNVDGVITTNFDRFLESIFTGYRTFVGQQSLLTQVPQSIAEIYKIHGCCTDPNSLILTQEDYDEFETKQAYLAAKLITIFVEHPVIFIGYSLTDPNILSLLRAIIAALGPKEIERIQNNLIFVQRTKPGRPPGNNSTILYITDYPLPITSVVVDSFKDIYRVVGEQKRHVPAAVLRLVKEHLYTMVQTSVPNETLCCVDIEDLDDTSKVEFVVGVGVAKNHLGAMGYRSIGAPELFTYLLHDDKKLHCEKVINGILSEREYATWYLPVFCFLHDLGIKSDTDYRSQTTFKLDGRLKKNRVDFRDKNPKGRSRIESMIAGMTTTEIIASFEACQAANLIPHQPHESIELEALRHFLLDNETSIYTKTPYTTLFRRLGCFYDRLRFGW